MTLVKQNFRTFNDLFDELFGAFTTTYAKETVGITPRVNIHETKDAFHLELVAPGLKKEDFKVTLEKGILSISYDKPAQAEQADYKTIRREFTTTGFKRSFNVDDQINHDGIQAKYENGILTLLLPKKEEVKVLPKAITIQ